jgi:hypothetical protein
MRSRHADLARKVGVSLAAAGLATGSAFAQQGRVTNGSDVPARGPCHPELLDTRTDQERCREAVSESRPATGERSTVRRSPRVRSAGHDRFAPDGVRDSFASPPTADSHFNISGGDPQHQQLLAGNLPQMTPLFVPPATLNDLPTTH